MSVEERVIIKIEVDADITNDLLLIEARIKALEDRFKGLDKKSKDIDKSTKKMDKAFGRVGQVVQKVDSAFLNFFKTLGKFSFIGMAVEIGVLSAALIGARLAMASGRIIAQGYGVVLKGVAAGALAVASAASVAASAIRQFGEAQLAPFVGGRKQAADHLRGISSNVGGLLGRSDAAALTGQLGKLGLSATQTNQALGQLYNISGGDTKSISSLITGLSGDASGFSKALAGIGPQGTYIAEAVDGLSKDDIIDQLTSGSLTPDAFKSFSDDLANTFMGSIKTQFFSLFGVFADLGATMVGPFQDAFKKMGSIVRSFILSTAPLIRKFGADAFAPSLLTGMQKTADFLEKLMRDNLPRLEGVGSRLSSMWKSTRNFFRDMADAMRPLEAGANVLLDTLGSMFGGLFGNGMLRSFNDILVRNADTFKDLGDSVGSFVRALLTAGSGDSLLSVVKSMTKIFQDVTVKLVPPLVSIANSIHEMVFSALPPIIDVLASMLSVVSSFTTGVTSVTSHIPGGGSSYANAALIGGALAIRSGKGRSALKAPSKLFSAAARSPGALYVNSATGGAPILGTAASAGAAVGGGLLAYNALTDSLQGDSSAFNIGQGVTGGAGIGFAVGGPVGAAVGAVLGGVITAGIGYWKHDGKRKNARKLGSAMISQWTDTLDHATGASVPAATQALEELINNEDALNKIGKERNLSATELRKTLQSQLAVVKDLEESLNEKLNTNLGRLAEVLSTTSEAAQAFADDKNLNLLSDTFGTLTLGQVVTGNVPAFQDRSVINGAFADTQFAKSKDALGAAESARSFERLLSAAGDLSKFSNTDIQDFITNRALQMQGDLSVGGANLTAAQADQEIIDFFRKKGGEGIVGAAELADQLDAGRSEILTTDFEKLGDLFHQDLHEFAGRPLFDILSVMEQQLSVINNLGPGSNESNYDYGTGARSGPGRGTPESVATGIVEGIAGLINEKRQASIEAGNLVGVTFNNVMTEGTMSEIAALIAPAVQQAIEDGLGMSTETSLPSPQTVPSGVASGLGSGVGAIVGGLGGGGIGMGRS